MNDHELLTLAREICTPRQQEALEHQAAGYGYRRIGRIMGITPAGARSLIEAAHLKIRKHQEAA